MLAGLGIGLGGAGCVRANIYAITDQSAVDAGADLNEADLNEVSVICPTAAVPRGNTNHMLQVDSLSRSYVLHIPPTYDGSRPAPLIIDFHAIGSSGQTEASTSPYPTLTDSEGVVMAFPDGLEGPAGNAWNVGPCCVDQVDDVDDVKFATTLVDDIAKSVCIDRSRVYAVGVSMGGGMANYLACHAADVFAAVAPAGFAFLKGSNVDNCIPSRPITTISFRGTAEVRVLYDGGSSTAVSGMPVTFLSAKETFDRWGQLDGCRGEPIVDTNGCSRYADCAQGVLVLLCTEENGREEPGDPTIAWPLLKSYVLQQ